MIETIKKRSTFVHVSKFGCRFVGRHLIIQVLPSDLSEGRVGYVATKKTGNAVHRNKIKRRLRALISQYSSILNPKYDYVCIARRSLFDADFMELQKDFVILLQKASQSCISDPILDTIKTD